MATEKKVDIVVFGATGDAGRCACFFLHNQGKLVGVESWAPAARNLDKLNKILGPILGENKTTPNDGIPASVPIKADSNNYESMLAMAKQAKVVIACAGPFKFYGENVVKACAEAGTDYVDLTGETPFVNKMAKKYGEDAKKKGLYVLSQAAFDSVPSDITVALGALTLMEKGETVGRAENHFLTEGASLPVGTLNTMLDAFITIRGRMIAAFTFGVLGGPTAEEKAKAAEMKKYEGAEGLVPKKSGPAIIRDLAMNFLTLYSPMTGKWSLPFFMAAANVPIVHTTAEKLGYGASLGHGFRYGEYFLSFKGGYFVVFALAVIALVVGPLIFGLPVLPFLCLLPVAIYLFPFGLILAGLFVLGGLFVCIFVPLITFLPGLVSFVAKKINDSDPGDVRKKTFEKLIGFQETGISACTCTVQSTSGNATVNVSMTSKYDAGLGFTGLCTATVAASVVEKRRQGVAGTGFSTAVAAIGPNELKKNLEKVGCEFKIEI